MRRILEFAIDGQEMTRLDSTVTQSLIEVDAPHPWLVAGSDNYVYAHIKIKVNEDGMLSMTRRDVEVLFTHRSTNNSSGVLSSLPLEFMSDSGDLVEENTIISNDETIWATLTVEVPPEMIQANGFNISVRYKYPNEGSVIEVTSNIITIDVKGPSEIGEGLDWDDDSYINARMALENSRIAYDNANIAISQSSEAIQRLADITTTVGSIIGDENIWANNGYLPNLVSIGSSLLNIEGQISSLDNRTSELESFKATTIDSISLMQEDITKLQREDFDYIYREQSVTYNTAVDINYTCNYDKLVYRRDGYEEMFFAWRNNKHTSRWNWSQYITGNSDTGIWMSGDHYFYAPSYNWPHTIRDGAPGGGYRDLPVFATVAPIKNTIDTSYVPNNVVQWALGEQWRVWVVGASFTWIDTDTDTPKRVIRYRLAAPFNPATLTTTATIDGETVTFHPFDENIPLNINFLVINNGPYYENTI